MRCVFIFSPLPFFHVNLQATRAGKYIEVAGFQPIYSVIGGFRSSQQPTYSKPKDFGCMELKSKLSHNIRCTRSTNLKGHVHVQEQSSETDRLSFVWTVER